ncbi:MULTISPECIES: MFS transporter [unclassified Streptomyces]|uniref:MFS transporter n=1 Tax=unclassified Streptomyces TaxID=2593676 RepID=UPI0006F6EA2B|nr:MULTISPECIES: MFS transporter [unclassified Streptomyces]KQX47414.1 MFS transporter [Streptomyces sp. Root1304]KRA94721.1 MFS transporter [Streptomyces sp. Root66D1]
MTLLAPTEPEPGPALAGRREWTALGVLMLPLLLVSMDVSVLYFAIPSISADLRPGATQQLWILDTYGFVLAGLLITMGALGDRLGRRRILLGGAALFGVASVAAAYAHTPGALIGARALLGVAGACLMPATLALIRVLFPDPGQRAKAVTLWTSVMAGGISLGPVVSGALVEHFWWGSVFLVSLPAMALLLVLGPLLLPESKGAAATGRFDVLSAALSLASLLTLVGGIKELAKNGWAPLPALAVLLGLLLAGVFLRRQTRLAHPMIDLGLLRNRAYGGSVLVNLLAMAATVGFAVFLTQYLQSVLGQSPFEAALWSLVPTGGVLLAAPAAAGLAGRIDRAYVMAGGFLLSAAGFAWLSAVDRATPLWVVLVGGAVYAGGLVSAMTLANELALGAAPPERAGAAAAVLESGQELGGALGMAVLGAVGAAVYTSAMPAGAPAAARETLGGALASPGPVLEAAREAFVSAMSGAAVGAAVLMAGATALSLVLLRARRGQEAR